jgi:hypothetical protein
VVAVDVLLTPARRAANFSVMARKNTILIASWLQLVEATTTLGSQKCGIVGKSQAVVIMINPIIFTRTRTWNLALQASAS